MHVIEDNLTATQLKLITHVEQPPTKLLLINFEYQSLYLIWGLLINNNFNVNLNGGEMAFNTAKESKKKDSKNLAKDSKTCLTWLI